MKLSLASPQSFVLLCVLCLMKMRLRALHPVAHGGIKYAEGRTSNSF